MRVRATKASKMYSIRIQELGRLAKEGEVFDIDPSRLSILTGDNKYNVKFVEPVEEETVEDLEHLENLVEELAENPIKDPKPKPAKRSRKTKANG